MYKKCCGIRGVLWLVGLEVSVLFRKGFVMKAVKTILVLLVLVCCVEVEGGFLDKLKDAGKKVGESAGKAKKKWEESEKECSECGRIIHVGTTCVSCKAKAARDATKRASEKVKKGASDAKKNWDARERKCSVCGRTIHLGTTCASCKAKAVKKRSKEVVDSGKKAWQKAKPELAVAKERVTERYTSFRRGMDEVYSTARRRYGVVLDKIRDPEVRRKATETLGVINKFCQKYRKAKKDVIYKGVDLFLDISIPTDGGDVTLGELAVARLSEKYPGLESTGMYDDPAAAVAAGISLDAKYFFGEVKLVKMSNGESLSVTDAIGRSSAFSASDTIKYLEIIEAASDVTYSLSTGEDMGEAFASVAGAVNFANN